MAIAEHCTELQELRLYASMPSARAIQGMSALRHLRLLDICGAHQATGTPLQPSAFIEQSHRCMAVQAGAACGVKGALPRVPSVSHPTFSTAGTAAHI